MRRWAWVFFFAVCIVCAAKRVDRASHFVVYGATYFYTPLLRRVLEAYNR